MSKYILRKHVYGFTAISNNIIDILKNDLEALGLYTYLLKLPDNWEFYKTQICKECKIGIKKLDKLLKHLSSFGLVKYGQKRNEKGRFSQFYIDIYDKEDIENSNLEYNDEPVCQNGRTVETVGRSGEAIKEILKTNKIKEKKKKTVSPVEKKKDKSDFDKRKDKEIYHPSHKEYKPSKEVRQEEPANLVKDYINKNSGERKVKGLTPKAANAMLSIREILKC